MEDSVIQVTWVSPSAAPTVDEASAPARVCLSFMTEMATLWLSHLGEHWVYPSPIHSLRVRSRAPRDCQAKMYPSEPGIEAKLE